MNKLSEIFSDRAIKYDEMSKYKSKAKIDAHYWLGTAGGCREASILLHELYERGYIEIVIKQEVTYELITKILD